MSSLNSHTESNENQPTFWTYNQFRQNLIFAETHHPPSESSLPEKIDAGAIGETINELNTKTATDPNHNEWALVLKLNLTNELEIQKTPVRGKKEGGVDVEVSLWSDTSSVSKKYQKHETLIAVLHTHPSDEPASIQDLSKLVTERADRESQLMSIVGTPALNYMYIRTLQTPEIPKGRKRSWIATWEREIRKRLQERIPKEMSGALRTNAETVIIYECVAELCEKYHIAMYVSDHQSTIYSRVLY